MGTLPADSLNAIASEFPEYSPAAAVLSHRHRFDRLVRAVEIFADFATVVLSVIFCWISYERLHLGKRLHYSASHMMLTTFFFSFVVILLMERDGAYESARSLLGVRETERVLRICVITFGLFFLSTVVAAHLVSRAMLLAAFVVVPLALILQKQVFCRFLFALHARGYGIQNVLIYGAGNTGRRLFSSLVRSPRLGLRPVAIVDDNRDLAGRQVHASSYRHQNSLAVKIGPIDLQMIRQLDARLILVCIPGIGAERLSHIAEQAFAAGSAVAFVPRMGTSPEPVIPGYVDIDGVLVASLLPAMDKPWYEAAKRMFDLFGAAALILATAPIWIAIAFAIALDSQGPIFFRQTRVGCKGRTFDMFKFRSMTANSPVYGLHPASAADPRITRVGRWIRRTSLDELPQLLNVLRGEMSLVGPRPEMPFIVATYDPYQRQRLRVKPGITGLWQISADRALLIHENPQYDLYYIRHRNFFMDIALLLHTVLFAMRGT
jgi:exopolysaccharide biosynthesis polyprenyl glycosylphosphotransferase